MEMIVAMARNGVIGLDGAMPWSIPSDLKRFRSLTMGHYILMGRKTYESIGRPLPGRHSIVLTRSSLAAPEGVHVVASLDDAFSISPPEAIKVIGGGEIYRLALPMASRLSRTIVQADIAGDTVFPELEDGWKLLTSATSTESGDSHPTVFEVLERRR